MRRPCDTCYSRRVCDNYESACGEWWRWFRAEWREMRRMFLEVSR